MAEHDRIRWHCRRGLLELDLLLDRFNRAHLDSLSLDQLAAYDELLELPDNDLLDLLIAPGQDDSAEDSREIVRLLRAA